MSKDTNEPRLKTGDRVYVGMPEPQKGYYIRDDNGYSEVVFDDGGSCTIAPRFVYATGEDVPRVVRTLCEALELERRREGFSIRDNHRLDNANRELEAQIDVCVDMAMDVLAGKEVYDEYGKAKIPMSHITRKDTLNKEDIWDRCMFMAAVRKKAESETRNRSIAEYEEEMKHQTPRERALGELAADGLAHGLSKMMEDFSDNAVPQEEEKDND